MKTERVHYDDPLRLSVEAEVIAHAMWEGTPSVILDRTVFYPESGGQMGDHGVVGEARVHDAQLDPEGRVHHLVLDRLPEIGATIEARVDAARRRTHMALHTGQHALSRALLDRLGAVTVSSRLGESACTIDVDVAGLSMDSLRPLEAAVERLIAEDRPVRQRFVSDEELEQLSLRKPAPDRERVRVVDIEGWDATPCGGTHVTHTAQIGLLFIDGVERYKGGSRIAFEAGPRARRLLAEESARLRSVAERLRCAPPEVQDIVDGIHAKLDAAREEAGTLRARLADVWAERIAADQGPLIASVMGGDAALLKAIAARLTTGDRLVALAAPGEDGTHVLIARGPDCDLRCGDLLRAVANACGGRGGGRPEHAQGKLPPTVAFEELVRAELARLGRD